MRLFWLFCLSVSLWGQTLDVSHFQNGSTSLAGQWRFHPGDDPRWADPTFDDSDWKLVQVPRSLGQQGYPGFSGYGWYRRELRYDHGPAHDLVVKSGLLASVGEFFANGLSLGQFGSFPPHARIYLGRPVPFPLPVSRWGTKGRLVLAIRVWKDPRLADNDWSGLVGEPPTIGTPLTIQAEIATQRYQTLLHGLLDLGIQCVELILAFYLIVLCLSHNRRPEYLWFALAFSCDAAGAALTWVARSTEGLTTPQLLYATSLFIPLFLALVIKGFWSLHGVAISWWVRVLLLALALSSVVGVIALENGHTGYLMAANSLRSPQVWLIILTLCTISSFLIRRLQSGVAEVRWVAICFGLHALAQIGNYLMPLWHKPWVSQRSLGTLNNTFYLASVIAVGYLLMRRFGQTQAERERLGTEMHAAREIQSLLLPPQSLSFPGFQIKTTYLPAHELGGDFFQLATASDGSLLMTVGDVSGKGVRAALTVSLIIGLWKEIAASVLSPAEILNRLNQQLEGSLKIGFVTCLCARIQPDGQVTIANAGHLAPYLNGVEVSTKNGLPLGVVGQTYYEDSQCLLTAPGMLVFISDGVIEARDKNRKLFGFERLQQALGQHPSAETLARSAQQFGQEDDITVMTISRQAVEMKPVQPAQAAAV